MTQEKTQKYYSSCNWRSGPIPCYEVLMDDSAQDSLKDSGKILFRDSDAYLDPVCAPVKERPLVTVIVKTYPRGLRVLQLFADELFLTKAEAREDCIRRANEWISFLRSEIERFEQRKTEILQTGIRQE